MTNSIPGGKQWCINLVESYVNIYYKTRSCYLMNSLFIPMKDSMISYTNNYFDETIFPSSGREKKIL